MPEDHLAVVELQKLHQANAVELKLDQLGECRLAILDWFPPKVMPIQRQKVEGI